MTQSQLYDEVVREFPTTWPTSPEWVWVNVHDGAATKLAELRAVIERYITSPKVIVAVHSKPGTAASLSKESACVFIGENILKYEIQVADPRFESFVFVSTSGAATGWSVATKSGATVEASE